MFTSYAVVVVENVSPEWDSDIPGKPPPHTHTNACACRDESVTCSCFPSWRFPKSRPTHPSDRPPVLQAPTDT